MAQALAVFKIIDDNASHRICKTEFENFIYKVLMKLGEENNEQNNQAFGFSKTKGELKSVLAQTLFKSSLEKSGSNLHFGVSKFGNLRNKVQDQLNQTERNNMLQMSTINLKAENILKNLSKLDENRYRKFKYVFNCPFATLKACLDITRELERMNQPLFSDSEFGPSDTDKYGANSIYHGETLPGYPQPEDMNWLRPPQIIPEGSNSI